MQSARSPVSPRCSRVTRPLLPRAPSAAAARGYHQCLCHHQRPAPGRRRRRPSPTCAPLLGPMGQFELQAVGAPENQEFIAGIPVKPGQMKPRSSRTPRMRSCRSWKGSTARDQVILKSTEFVGARMAQSLATQTIWLVLIAVALILVYMMFRFHPCDLRESPPSWESCMTRWSCCPSMRCSAWKWTRAQSRPS